jgi:hypothetical protein
VVAALLLRRAARANPGGVVLVSTIRTGHLRSAVEAIATARQGDDEELAAFSGLLDAELGTGPHPARSDSLR